MELNRFQIANVRKVYQMTKMDRRKLKKVEEKIAQLEMEKAQYVERLESMDAIVKPYTNGMTAEETMIALGLITREEAISEVENEKTAQPEVVNQEVETMKEAAAENEPLEELLNEQKEETPQAPQTEEKNEADMPEWMKIAEQELK